MEEKTIHCPVCETPTNAKSFLQTYISPYNNQEYKMYECANCQVQWWEPLKMIPEFYESEAFEHYVTLHVTTQINLGENHKAFFKYFPSDIKGKLLDVGCGDGRFIRYAKEYGYEVWGIDFDKKSVENVKRNFGINTVFAMSLEEFYKYAKEKGLQFDVITFFEVLEHQDKPKELRTFKKRRVYSRECTKS
jgi:2-polyprenyl-3-methyl-5-hydroxy-6-metoxy-1,4-benzoquinol methylase